MTFLELAARFDDLVKAEPDLSTDEAWKTIKRLSVQIVDLWDELGFEPINGLKPPAFDDRGDGFTARQKRRWSWWRTRVTALAHVFPSRIAGGFALSGGDVVETSEAPGVSALVGNWPRARWRAFAHDFAAACRLLDEIHRTRQAEATANNYAAARLNSNDPYFQIAAKAATLADMYPMKRDELRWLAEQCDSKEGCELFGLDLKAASDVWDELERERKLLFALIVKHMPTEAKAMRVISQGGRWSANDKAVDITAAVGELRGVAVDARRQIGTLGPEAGEAMTAGQKSRLAAPPPKVSRRPGGYVEDVAIATMVNGQWKSQPRPQASLHCEPLGSLATKLKASIADNLPLAGEQSTHHRADPELAGGFFAVRKVLKDLLTAFRNRYAETGNPAAQLVHDAALSPAQCAALTSLWKCLDRVQAWCDTDSGEGPIAHFPDDLLAQFNSSVDVFLRAIQYGDEKSDADDLEALKRERHELVSDLVQHKQALRGITMELVEATKGKGTTKQMKAKKQKGKGGRPPLTPKERKRRLEAIAEWDRAKQYMQMKVFVQDKNYSLRELNTWLNTNSKSKSRAE